MKMNLPESLFDLVGEHAHDDPAVLRLRFGGKDLGFDPQQAIDQVECRQKTRRKLPWFNSFPRFAYPSVQAAEQASNQYVASWHATLVRPGMRVLDMTAGLGVDSMTLALAGAEVTAIELDAARADVLRHNAEEIGLENYEAIQGDSVEYIGDADCGFDMIFIDPARRGDGNRRTYFLEDSIPDVTVHAPLMLRNARRVVVKASPILDLSRALTQLPCLSGVDIVCLRGECKEVLLMMEREKGEERPLIRIVDLAGDDEGEYPYLPPREISRFEYRLGEAEEVHAPVAAEAEVREARYLYHPNAGVMKMKCAGEICRGFEGMKQAGRNTMLFVSDGLHRDFPGRVFRVESEPDRKELKKMKGERYGVIARNYTMTAEQLRRKLGTRESDTDYLVAMKAGTKETPLVLRCTKVS